MRVLCRKGTGIKSKAGLDQPHGSTELDVIRTGLGAQAAGRVGALKSATASRVR